MPSAASHVAEFPCAGGTRLLVPTTLRRVRTGVFVMEFCAALALLLMWFSVPLYNIAWVVVPTACILFALSFSAAWERCANMVQVHAKEVECRLEDNELARSQPECRSPNSLMRSTSALEHFHSTAWSDSYHSGCSLISSSLSTPHVPENECRQEHCNEAMSEIKLIRVTNSTCSASYCDEGFSDACSMGKAWRASTLSGMGTQFDVATVNEAMCTFSSTISTSHVPSTVFGSNQPSDIELCLHFPESELKAEAEATELSEFELLMGDSELTSEEDFYTDCSSCPTSVAREGEDPRQPDTDHEGVEEAVNMISSSMACALLDERLKGLYCRVTHLRHQIPANQLCQVHITMPWSDPDELLKGGMQELIDNFEARFPDLKVVRHAVRKGSLMLALDVICAGAFSHKQASQNEVPISDLWMEWLDLPWPKNNAKTYIQVGNQALALAWDEGSKTWVAQGTTQCVGNGEVLTDVHPLVLVSEPDTDALDVRLSSRSNFAEDGIMLRGRGKGRAIRVEITEDPDASVPTAAECLQPVVHNLLGKLTLVGDGEPTTDPLTSLATLEVWRGPLLSQSVPILVLSPHQAGMARELGSLHLVGEEDANRKPGAPTYASTLVAKLGMWLDYIAGLQKSKADPTAAVPNPRLKRYMVASGQWLLDHALTKGWAHVAKEVLDGLINHCDMSFKGLACGSNESGHTLLHLAVLSGKAYMVALVVQWGAELYRPWSWHCVDRHGVTPLHMVALSKNASFASSILRHFEHARLAWRSSKGRLDSTPEQVAHAVGLVVEISSKKGGKGKRSKSSSGLMPSIQSRFSKESAGPSSQEMVQVAPAPELPAPSMDLPQAKSLEEGEQPPALTQPELKVEESQVLSISPVVGAEPSSAPLVPPPESPPSSTESISSASAIRSAAAPAAADVLRKTMCETLFGFGTPWSVEESSYLQWRMDTTLVADQIWMLLVAVLAGLLARILSARLCENLPTAFICLSSDGKGGIYSQFQGMLMFVILGTCIWQVRTPLLLTRPTMMAFMTNTVLFLAHLCAVVVTWVVDFCMRYLYLCRGAPANNAQGRYPCVAEMKKKKAT